MVHCIRSEHKLPKFQNGDQSNYPNGPYYQNRPYNAPRPPFKCFRCDQIGHTKQNCTAVLMVYPGNQPPYPASQPGPSNLVSTVQNPVSTATVASQNSTEVVASNSGTTAPPVQAVHQVQQQTFDKTNQVWAPITPVTSNSQMQAGCQDNSGFQSN